jgi:hypothetical protein
VGVHVAPPSLVIVKAMSLRALALKRPSRQTASSLPLAGSTATSGLKSAVKSCAPVSGSRTMTLARAWRCQQLLYRRWRRMTARRKPHQKIVVACARELAGFVWAIGSDQLLAGRAERRGLANWSSGLCPALRRTLDPSVRRRWLPEARDARARQLPTVPRHAVPTRDCQLIHRRCPRAVRCSQPRGQPRTRAHRSTVCSMSEAGVRQAPASTPARHRRRRNTSC